MTQAQGHKILGGGAGTPISSFPAMAQGSWPPLPKIDISLWEMLWAWSYFERGEGLPPQGEPSEALSCGVDEMGGLCTNGLCGAKLPCHSSWVLNAALFPGLHQGHLQQQ